MYVTFKKLAHEAGFAACLAMPAAILLAAGWWSGMRRAEGLDGALRGALAGRAEAAAADVDTTLAAQLLFSPEDKDGRAYAAVGAALAAACAGAGPAGLYTLASRDGRLVFGPSACGAGDPQPGGAYAGDPAPALRALETGRPEVLGPSAGAAGLTARAFVPVMGESGKSIMLVAMEVPAAAWASEVAAARRAPVKPLLWLALPAALALIFLRMRGIGAALPAILSLALGAAIFLVSAALPAPAGPAAALARTEWNKKAAEAAAFLSASADGLQNAPVLREAWEARDRQALAEAAEPEAASLAAGRGLDCMNFLEPDGAVFYSAGGHYPGRPSARATLRQAMADGRDAWGLEPGPDGALSLRYVRPLAGASSGYLELGVSANALAAGIGRALKLDISDFARPRAGGRGDAVHDLQLEAALPERPGPDKHPGGWLGGAGGSLALTAGGRSFSGSALSLATAGGRPAELIALSDITPVVAETEGKAAFRASAAAALLFLALAILWPSRVPAREPERGIAERALDLLRQGYLLVDSRGRVAAVNRAYCRMSGYSQAELKGMPLGVLEQPKTSGDDGASTHRRKDGTTFEARSSINWIPEQGGFFAAFIDEGARPARTPLFAMIGGNGEEAPSQESLPAAAEKVPAMAAAAAVPAGTIRRPGPPSVRGSF